MLSVLKPTDTLFSLGFLIYTRFRTPLTRSKVHQRFEDIYKVPKGIRWIRVRELRFWYPYTCSPSVLEATQNPKQQLYLLRQQSGLMYFRNISSQPHENHTQCLERNTQKWRPNSGWWDDKWLLFFNFKVGDKINFLRFEIRFKYFLTIREDNPWGQFQSQCNLDEAFQVSRRTLSTMSPYWPLAWMVLDPIMMLCKCSTLKL